MAENTSKTATYKIILDTDSGLIKVQGLTKGFQEADVAIKQMQESAINLQKKGLDPMINKTGLAGATVQEAGRTISDFNYGIRGMANNLSQLGSLFVNLISTTGGFANAMRALWSALAGPLGIIIVLQTVLTLWEGYDMAQSKAEAATKNLTKAIEGQLNVLRNISSILKLNGDVSGSITLLRKEFSEFAEVYDSLSKTDQGDMLRLKNMVSFYSSILEQRKAILSEQEKYDNEESLSARAEIGAKLFKMRVQEAEDTALFMSAKRKKEKKKNKDHQDDLSKDMLAALLELEKMIAEEEKITFWEMLLGKNAEKEKIEQDLKDIWNMVDSIEEVEFAEWEESEEEKNLRREAKRQENLEKMQMYADAAGMVMSGLADFFDADFERQMTLEENKTNALNNELRSRLENEKISAEERASIQNQIYQNDEKLRKRQEQIEEKRFKMNKAANIANAVINTFLAATGVLAQTNGGPIARIVAMTAVISAGLLQVAAIARSKFQTSASSAPPSLGGTAGGSSGQQAPDFNIVGSSGVNQLRTAIEGQLNRPIKTYVTTKDVSTGQELDRNIVQGATFGN